MIHDSYFIMIIMIQISVRDYLGSQGDLNEFGVSSQREQGGLQGVPNTPLSSVATWTGRAGTSVHSAYLGGVPVELQVLYIRSCFLPSTHPTTWERDTAAYQGFFG